MARKTVKKTKKAVKKEDEELVQCISCGKCLDAEGNSCIFNRKKSDK